MLGQRFHYWLVVEKLTGDYYRCACKCGTEKSVFGANLRAGKTKSCGCYGRERYKVINKTHGMSKTPEFRIWSGLKSRCTNVNAHNYDRYGGRGIKVSERWGSFEAFYADMGPRPSDKHSIDRLDVNGNYERENCRWATNYEQASNKRGNVLLELDGEVVTSAEFARRTGFNRDTVYQWTTVKKYTREEIEVRLLARARLKAAKS